MNNSVSSISMQGKLDAVNVWALNPNDREIEAWSVARRIVELRREPEVAFKEKAPAGLADWQKKKIVRYVDGNIDTKLRVSDLSEQVRLSVSRFSKAFNVTFGRPPYDYVLSRRIEAAKYLIASTDEPLSQIAHACGLSDQAHLSKVFKRIVKTTPLKWRKSASFTRSTQWDYLAVGAGTSPRCLSRPSAAM